MSITKNKNHTHVHIYKHIIKAHVTNPNVPRMQPENDNFCREHKDTKSKCSQAHETKSIRLSMEINITGLCGPFKMCARAPSHAEAIADSGGVPSRSVIKSNYTDKNGM